MGGGAGGGRIPRVIRLAIRVPSERAEVVLAELLDLVPSGLEERELEHGLTEYAIYGAPGELPALPELRASIGDALVEVSTSELPDDWAERWREFHRAVFVEPPPETRAGARPPALNIRPPWIGATERPGALDVVIDPGQAFGTGAHATTRLCLELLLELAATGARGPVLDIGTGSGVLAIAASLLGFAPVCALDIEAASVEAARANVARNGAHVAVERADVRRGVARWERPPVLLANLVRPLLLELASALPAPPAHVIAGGLLAHEVDEVLDAYATHLTLRERARRRSGEWAAVWLSPPPESP